MLAPFPAVTVVQPPRRRGLTLLELLVVMAIIAILVSLLLPVVQQARESARRLACSNNLKQIGLAMHAYHETKHMLPFLRGGPGHDGGDRWSGMVHLLPFLEQQPLYELYTNQAETGGTLDPGQLWTRDGFTPNATRISLFLCPSDPIDDIRQAGFAPGNYVFCAGDRPGDPLSSRPRGAFGFNICSRLGFIEDGSSNTMAMSETARPLGERKAGEVALLGSPAALLRPADCVALWDDELRQYQPAATLTAAGQQPGLRWSDGGTLFGSYLGALGPNRGPACLLSAAAPADTPYQPGLMTAASRHRGGVLVLLLDGSVRFISDSIDAGDPQAPFPLPDDNLSMSPYGVWGSLSTKASGERPPEF